MQADRTKGTNIRLCNLQRGMHENEKKREREKKIPLELMFRCWRCLIIVNKNTTRKRATFDGEFSFQFYAAKDLIFLAVCCKSSVLCFVIYWHDQIHSLLLSFSLSLVDIDRKRKQHFCFLALFDFIKTIDCFSARLSNARARSVLHRHCSCVLCFCVYAREFYVLSKLTKTKWKRKKSLKQNGLVETDKAFHESWEL